MAQYASFQAFYSEDEAVAMAMLLENENIPTKITVANPLLDTLIIGEDYQPGFFLMIPVYEFDKAHHIIQEKWRSQISKIPADHYLYSFSDDELLKIIARPDEWSSQDYVLATEILQAKGYKITDEKRDEWREQRNEFLAAPESADGLAIISGYVLAFMGGVIGLIFGLSFLHAKKQLPDGRKVNSYDEKTRSHGRAMVLISVAEIITALALKVGMEIMR
jgi:hypothetical protein